MLFILFVSTVFNIANSAIVPVTNNNEVSPLAMCIHEIYELHKNFYKTTILINDDYETKEDTDTIFQESIMKIVIENEIPAIETNNLNKINRIREINDTTVINVVYLKSCDELESNIDHITFDIKFRYIIIVDTFQRDKCNDIITTKLSDLSNYDATFITVDTKANTYNFLTAIPEIDAVACNNSEIVQIKIINACSNGTLDEKKLNHIFPIKTPSNFNLCNFNVGLTTRFPFSMTDNMDTLKELESDAHFYGLDVEIMKIMAKRFNSTLKLFYNKRNDYDETLRVKIIQYLQNKTLDACAGGIYRLYKDEVSYSGIYSRQAVIWVYTVERDKRIWKSLLFKMNGLYIFLIIYKCYILLWNLISKFDYRTISIIESFVYGWGAMFGGTGLQDARSLKQKFLNIVYLIACLHLSVYVSTQIFYYLTIDRPPNHFKTLEEFILSGKVPYLIPQEKYFIDDKKHIAFVNTSRNCNTFVQCEAEMLKNKGSTIIVDGRLASLQASSAVHDEARVLSVPEDILIVYHEMVLRKSGSFVVNFQKYTQRLFEAGIFQKLYVEAIGIIVVDKAKIANQNILSNSYSCTVGCEITVSESAGVFYVWMIGCGFSCFVFVLEMLMKMPSLKY